jgi:DNA-binding transcriptional LysR family regulator
MEDLVSRKTWRTTRTNASARSILRRAACSTGSSGAGKELISVAVNGRLTVTDSGTKLGACLAGFGIAQVIDLGLDHHFESGALINLFPDWSDERFPLYVYYVSRNHVPAKIRKFIDFIVASLGKESGTASKTKAPNKREAMITLAAAESE